MRGPTRAVGVTSCACSLFQSTGLMRGPTFNRDNHRRHIFRFNPQASCEARLHPIPVPMIPSVVSIHRPHARPDIQRQKTGLSCGSFNPQASCEARLYCARYSTAASSVSIHRPHARPDCMDHNIVICLKVSIHRPHARPDPLVGLSWLPAVKFQSTGLMRGPTGWLITLQGVAVFQSTGLMRGPTTK